MKWTSVTTCPLYCLTHSNQDHVVSGGTAMGTDINLTLSTQGDSYGFFVVAFSDTPKCVAQKVATIGLGKVYFLDRLASSSVVIVVVEMLLDTCTICSSSYHLFTQFSCPHSTHCHSFQKMVPGNVFAWIRAEKESKHVAC